MEDIQGSVSDQHHVPVSMGSDNAASGSDAMHSTRNTTVSKPGAHNVLDKKHTFSSLPLYQQGGFHYHTGHAAVFPQVSSTKYNDRYSVQYPFAYSTMAVDMTNRSNNVDTNARNPNGIVETSSVRQTKFTDDRLHIRDLNISSKLSRIKYGKNPERSTLWEQQYVKSDNLSNLSGKKVSECMDNTSSRKDDESGNRKCKDCEEKTEVDDANMIFSCGGCDLSFYSICKLHAHIKSHDQSGSYFYSELTRTAYPKFGTCCTGSQTEECDNKQKCLENSRTLNQELGCCSTGTQTISQRANKKHLPVSRKAVERLLKKEGELVGSNEENLRTREDEFETEVFEEKPEIKVEKDDFEEVAVTQSTVNPDSDTDEYTPEETLAKNRLKRPNSSNEYGKRKKCKVGGTRKLKQLKVTTKLRQEDRKDKRKSFVTKERNQEAVTKRKKVVEKIACKLCGTSFIKKLMLRQHIKAEHLDVPNICLLCSSSFPTNDKLIEHRKTEHNKGCHQCELCDKVLSTKGMLEGHYLIHKGIKPFSCVICVPKKEFTRKCQLKVNISLL